MRRFTCPGCAARVFFTDRQCLNCSAQLCYDPVRDAHLPLAAAIPCINRDRWSCTWLAPQQGGACEACALDIRTTPADPFAAVFQTAKRRVLRQLFGFGIDPVGASPPLRFELLRGTADSPVTIGHADGLISLDTSEGDPSHLEAVRARLGEPYRTPLGHIRHEIGHWHWQASVAADPGRLVRFREVFGDERRDYAQALQQHYERVGDGAWTGTHLSYYATAHPWEDYAESFAHVLHMHAILETARAEGFVAEQAHDLPGLIAQWAPLTVSLNEMARAMGTPDPYPFAPPAAALRKMGFVYNVITSGRS